jgi:hypothetical protein
MSTEMEVITLDRTGLPPIRFTGSMIGHAMITTGAGRRTDVGIYRSKGGKWLAQVGHLTQWEKEHDSYSATSTDTATGLIEWLTADNDGHLGRASQEACENAAKNDPEFAKAFVEEVE